MPARGTHLGEHDRSVARDGHRFPGDRELGRLGVGEEFVVRADAQGAGFEAEPLRDVFRGGRAGFGVRFPGAGAAEFGHVCAERAAAAVFPVPGTDHAPAFTGLGDVGAGSGAAFQAAFNDQPLLRLLQHVGADAVFLGEPGPRGELGANGPFVAVESAAQVAGDHLVRRWFVVAHARTPYSSPAPGCPGSGDPVDKLMHQVQANALTLLYVISCARGRSVRLPNTQATAIASMLTSLGATPARDDMDERVRLEAEVPPTIGEATLAELLRLLVRAADRFGHSLQKDGTSVIWAEIDADDPQDLRGES